MTSTSIAAATYAANQGISKETIMPTNSFAAAAYAASQNLASGVRRSDGAAATEGQSFGALLSGAVGSVAEAGKAAEAQALRGLMRGVVTGGTASFLSDVPGADVLAKTGTAEYGSDDPPKSHAWIIGIQGDLAVAVFVDEGEGGAATAGPILERFLRAIG